MKSISPLCLVSHHTYKYTLRVLVTWWFFYTTKTQRHKGEKKTLGLGTLVVSQAGTFAHLWITSSHHKDTKYENKTEFCTISFRASQGMVSCWYNIGLKYPKGVRL